MVQLTSFSGINLRCIEKVALEEFGRLNVIAGANGAGKTSILEGIYALASGRSFRTRRLVKLIRHGEDFLRVTGRVGAYEPGTVSTGVNEESNEVHHIGLERDRERLVIRCDGESINRASDLARLLPTLVVRPESYEVLTGGSEERRRILDWTVFHVKPEFAEAHRGYNRALKQRNALLKSAKGFNSAVLTPWTRELAAFGERVEACRQEAWQEHKALIEASIVAMTGVPVSMNYRRGWDQNTELYQSLSENIDSERERGTTMRGPHRADIRFVVDKEDARQVLSRGEGKRLVLAFLLGMAQIVSLSKGHTPVFLLDDLASELDEDARAQFVESVLGTGFQTFITTVDSSLIAAEYLSDAAVFHVKHGGVNRVL